MWLLGHVYHLAVAFRNKKKKSVSFKSGLCLKTQKVVIYPAGDDKVRRGVMIDDVRGCSLAVLSLVIKLKEMNGFAFH